MFMSWVARLLKKLREGKEGTNTGLVGVRNSSMRWEERREREASKQQRRSRKKIIGEKVRR